MAVQKLRVEITKGEPVRYLSHLEYLRAIERALRRSALPIAYTEGFNPHMKMSFASALAVGVTSSCENLELEMAEPVACEAFVNRLAKDLPEGIVIKRCREVPLRGKSLMSEVRLASYTVSIPVRLPEALAGERFAEKVIESFWQAPIVLYTRHNPKGRREINLKSYITDLAAKMENECLNLLMKIRITGEGSAKPEEVLEALAAIHGSSFWEPDEALAHRTGLFAVSGHNYIPIFEV